MDEITIDLVVKTDPKISPVLQDKVVKRLYSLGYNVTKKDIWSLSFAIEKVHQYILNFCDILELPTELFYTATERIVGEFLFDKMVRGELDEDFGVKFGEAAKEIEIGDARAVYYSDPNKVRYESMMIFIDNLRKFGEDDLLCFRTMSW